MKNPAADHAAQAIVIYDLQRPGAFESTQESTPSQSVTETAQYHP
jgi:hypothetical protein